MSDSETHVGLQYPAPIYSTLTFQPHYIHPRFYTYIGYSGITAALRKEQDEKTEKLVKEISKQEQQKLKRKDEILRNSWHLTRDEIRLDIRSRLKVNGKYSLNSSSVTFLHQVTRA